MYLFVTLKSLTGIQADFCVITFLIFFLQGWNRRLKGGPEERYQSVRGFTHQCKCMEHADVLGTTC